MPEESTTPTQTAVSEVLDLTELIKNQSARIDHLNKELSKVKEMLQSIFDNDPTYRQHDEAVKEATKIRSATKKQLSRLPQAADLLTRIQESREQIKELRDSLSEYLQEYQKATGSFQFEGENGEVHEIVYNARLVRKSEFRP